MSSPTADAGPQRRRSGGLSQDEVDRRWASIAIWRKRSRMIRALRIGLPAGMGLILLSLFAFVLFNGFLWRFGPADNGRSLSIRMINPKFYGRMADGRSYLLSAGSATRDARDFPLIVLVDPVMIVGHDTPSPSRLQARGGFYREDDRIVRLTGDVRFNDAAGYQFDTQKAIIDTVHSHVAGESPVEGHGPLGRIAASSYAITDGGQRILFKGKVRTHIVQAGRP